VNDTPDDTWDNKAMNRISAIHFLDDDEEEDDDKVRPASPRAYITVTSSLYTGLSQKIRIL